MPITRGVMGNSSTETKTISRRGAPPSRRLCLCRYGGIARTPPPRCHPGDLTLSEVEGEGSRKLALSGDRKAIEVERGPAVPFRRLASGHEFTHAATRPPFFREIKYAAKPRSSPAGPHLSRRAYRRAAFLLDHSGLSQRDIAPELGGESTVSPVLSGKRKLNRGHIARLSRRFHVSPAVFFRTASA